MNETADLLLPASAGMNDPTMSTGYEPIKMRSRGRSIEGRRKARSRSNSPSPRNQPFDRCQSPHDFRRRLLSGDKPRSRTSSRPTTPTANFGTDALLDEPLPSNVVTPALDERQSCSATAEDDLNRLFSVLETDSQTSKHHVPLRSRALPASFWSPKPPTPPSRLNGTRHDPNVMTGLKNFNIMTDFGSPMKTSLPPPPPMGTPTNTLKGRTDPILGQDFKLEHTPGDTPLKAQPAHNIPDIVIQGGENPSHMYDLQQHSDGLDLFQGLGECLDVELALLGITDDTANIFDDLGINFS